MEGPPPDLATLRPFYSNAPRVLHRLRLFSNASRHQKYTFCSICTARPTNPASELESFGNRKSRVDRQGLHRMKACIKIASLASGEPRWVRGGAHAHSQPRPPVHRADDRH